MQAAALLFVVCALVASCYADGLPTKNCDSATSKHVPHGLYFIYLAVKLVVADHALMHLSPCVALTESGIKVFNSTWTCTKEPCPIIKGKDISILITITNNGKIISVTAHILMFSTPRPVSLIFLFMYIGDDIVSLSNNVYGVVLGVPVPFPGYPDGMKNVCALNSTSSSSCPIKKGGKYTEEVVLPVVKDAPNVRVRVMFVSVAKIDSFYSFRL